jgi:hypothetical protein
LGFLSALLAIPLSAAACVPRPTHVTEIEGAPLATLRPAEDIPSVHDPDLLTASEADRVLRQDSEVIGFVLDGQPVAVALRLLDEHEIVNLQLGDRDGNGVAATW